MGESSGLDYFYNYSFNKGKNVRIVAYPVGARLEQFFSKLILQSVYGPFRGLFLWAFAEAQTIQARYSPGFPGFSLLAQASPTGPLRNPVYIPGPPAVLGPSS